MSLYIEDSDDDVKVRKIKKKKIPKLPTQNIIIKNADKDTGWCEKWVPGQNIGLLPHPFRLVALGSVGRGKTNSCKQIFLRHQCSRRKFKKLIVITCDIESQEWLDCSPTILTDEMVGLEEFDDGVKTCVIIDDFEMQKASSDVQRKMSTLFRFISSHKNVSVMLSYQSFFDCLPIARKCATQFLLYKPNSRMELDTVSNRCGIDSKDMRYIFKHICSGPYDNLMVDLSVHSPARLRKNIYEVITMDSDSD
jgi:hypothetical protein